MDPFLLSLGSAGLGHAVKFLFDRAHAALDRRAAAAQGDGNDAAAEAELSASVTMLAPYRDALDDTTSDTAAGQAGLITALERVQRALERIEGAPIDVAGAVESAVRVEQQVDRVVGTVTGAEVAAPGPGSNTHVRQRIGSVDEGGSVTGYRGGR